MENIEIAQRLKSIEGGADIIAYGIAKGLRDIQAHKPELIYIGPVMGEYDGAGQMPYFGAIPTKEGFDFIAQYLPNDEAEI